MNVIRVSKNPNKMTDEEFTRHALKELQKKLKAKGETFAFDISKRQQGKGRKR